MLKISFLLWRTIVQNGQKRAGLMKLTLRMIKVLIAQDAEFRLYRKTVNHYEYFPLLNKLSNIIRILGFHDQIYQLTHKCLLWNHCYSFLNVHAHSFLLCVVCVYTIISLNHPILLCPKTENARIIHFLTKSSWSNSRTLVKHGLRLQHYISLFQPQNTHLIMEE